MSAYLDTHTAVWLHDGLEDEFSERAKREIDASDLLISPMVLLEMEYLYRRRRIGVEPLAIYAYLNSTIGVRLCDIPFSVVAVEAISVAGIDDPFDRVIIAQAKANHHAPLITRDRRIREHYHCALW